MPREHVLVQRLSISVVEEGAELLNWIIKCEIAESNLHALDSKLSTQHIV